MSKAVLLLASLAMAAPLAGQGDEKVVIMPMKQTEGIFPMPYVTVSSRGNSIQLNIDSGSSDTYLNSNDVCQKYSCAEGPPNYAGQDFDDTEFTVSPDYDPVPIAYADKSSTNLTLGHGKLDFGAQQPITLNYSLATGLYTQPKIGVGFMQNEAVVNVFNDSAYVNIGPGLVASGKTNRNCFSIGGDALIFGGYDSNLLDDDEFQMMDMVDRYAASDPQPIWHTDVAFTGFSLISKHGEKKTDLFASSNISSDSVRRFMSMDTGAAAMNLEADLYEQVMACAGVSIDDADSRTTVPVVPCDNPLYDTELELTLGNGTTIKSPIKTLVRNSEGQCGLAITSQSSKTTLNTISWLILKEHYLLYDLDALQIGIGRAKQQSQDGGRKIATLPPYNNNNTKTCTRR